MSRIFTFIFLFLFVNLQAQVANNMDLLSNWSTGNTPWNDVWAYVDSKGNEYAIIGSRSHYYFVDISNPTNPQMIDGFAGGTTTIWRDMKTYSQWAYGVCDSCNEGLAIFFMGDDPSQNGVQFMGQNTQFFSRSHNIFIDEEHGRLYAIGTNTQSQGVIILDIKTNPEQPTLLAATNLPGGYIHDMYVKNHIGYANSGNNGLYMYDFSNPDQIRNLGNLTSYPQQGYNHSSWLDPSGQYLAMADETHNTSLKLVDVSNPSDIEVESLFRSELLAPAATGSIAHNPFIRDDYVIISYYHDGVQVFDISDPSNPVQVAGYDTFPNNNGYGGFSGCWGAYPFLPSGNILGSDGSNGLFVLRPTNITFTPPPPTFPPFAVLSQQGPICLEPGESLTLSVDTDADVIQWFRNNQQVGFEEEIEITAAGTYISRVFKGPHSVTQVIEVSLGTPPDAELNVSGSFEICEGNSLLLEAPAGANSYTWLYNNLIQNNFTSSFEADQIGSYQVIVSNGDCEAASDVVLVTAVTEAADLTLNVSETQEICSGESVSLEVPEGADAYQWFLNGEAIDGANMAQFMASMNGLYHVEGTLGSCMTSSDEVFVQVVSNPDASLNFVGSEEICSDETFELMLPQGAEIYEWYLDGELVQSSESNAFTANTSGVYNAIAFTASCEAASENFELTVVEQPEVTIEQETFNSICEDDEITFTLSGNADNIVWIKDGEVIEDENGLSLTTNEPGAYEVSANNGNCFANSNIVNLAVFEIPAVEVNLAQFNEICEGDELEIALSSGEGNVTWTKDGEVFAEFVVSILVTESGVYQATVTDGPCSNVSSVVEVSVLEQLEAVLEGPALVEICEGESYALSLENGSANVEWFRDGTSFANDLNSIAVTASGTYFAVVGEGNCAGTSDAVEIIVNENPDASLASLDAVAICSGEVYVLEAAPDQGTYTWFRNDVMLNENGNSLSIDDDGIYHLEISNGDCEDRSQNIAIELISAPSVDLLIPNMVDLCEGENLLLEPSTNGETFQWFKDGELVSTDFSLLVETSGTYFLRTAIQSCESSSEEITVSFTALPDASIMGSTDVMLCEGEESTLMLAGTAEQYQWFFNGAPLGNQQSQLADQSGVYYAELSNGDCSSRSADIVVEIIEDLDLNFNFTENQELCEGEVLNLEVPAGADSYQWTFNGMPLNNNSNALELSEAGAYRVEAILGNCTAASSVFELEYIEFPSVILNQSNAVEICEGETVTLEIPSGADSYEWYINGEVLAAANGNLIEVNESGTYQVSAANSDCAAFSDEIQIEVFAFPELSLDASASSFCEGGSVDLNLIGEANEFTWILNGNPIDITDATLSLEESAEIQVIASNGNCESSTEILSINLIENPEVELVASDDLVLCQGESLELNAVGNASNYVWLLDGIEIDADTESITATEAGSYSVIASLDGCMSSSASLEVVLVQNPEVEIVASEDLVLCEGESLELNALGNASNYQWFLDGVEIDADTESITVSEPGNYSVIASLDGCTSSSSNLEVMVNQIPEAALTVEGDDEICSGESVSLSVSNGDGYEWFLNGESLGINASELEASESGIYQVIVTSNDCSNASETFDLSVIEAPSVVLDNELTNDICEGDDLLLSTSTLADNYSWLLNGEPIADANASSLMVTESGTYTLLAANGDCSSASDEIMVDVTAIPELSINNGMEGISFCANEDKLLQINGEAETYVWIFNGEEVANAQSLEINEEGIYQAIASNGNCVSEPVEIEVSFEAAPDVSLTFPDGETFCEGQTALIEALPGFEFYFWSLNGEPVGTNNSSISVTEGGNYTLNIVDGNCSEETDFEITVNPLPSISIQADAFEICPGDFTTLSASQEDATSYIWFRDGQVIEGANGSELSISQAGAYSVEVVLQGCANTSSELIISVFDVIIASFEVDGTLLIANEGVSYQWLLNGEEIPGANERNFQAEESGIYQVSIVDANGCTSLSMEIQVTVTSIESLELKGDLSIFPNPASAFIEVHFETLNPSNHEIIIYDELGRIVHYLGNIEGQVVRERIEINDFSSGIYLLQIRNEEGKSATYKFIKTK